MSTDGSQGGSESPEAANNDGRLLQFIRRRPVAAVLTLLGLLALTELTTTVVPGFDVAKMPGCPAGIRQHRSEVLARKFVALALEEIGHGVEISSVDGLWSLDEIRSAGYSPTDKSISFSVDYYCPGWEVHQYSLLAAISHECAHAIFLQAGLSIRNSGDATLINADEMAASVLGAHLGGRVADRLGWPGRKFELVNLTLYRENCSNPAIRKSDTHFGPVEVFHGMHRICTESPDIWTAAHRVAEQYFIADEFGHWVYWDEDQDAP